MAKSTRECCHGLVSGTVHSYTAIECSTHVTSSCANFLERKLKVQLPHRTGLGQQNGRRFIAGNTNMADMTSYDNAV